RGVPGADAADDPARREGVEAGERRRRGRGRPQRGRRHADAELDAARGLRAQAQRDERVAVDHRGVVDPEAAEAELLGPYGDFLHPRLSGDQDPFAQGALLVAMPPVTKRIVTSPCQGMRRAGRHARAGGPAPLRPETCEGRDARKAEPRERRGRTGSAPALPRPALGYRANAWN